MSTSPCWTCRVWACPAMRAICAGVKVGNMWSGGEATDEEGGGFVSVMAIRLLRVFAHRSAILLRNARVRFSRSVHELAGAGYDLDPGWEPRPTDAAWPIRIRGSFKRPSKRARKKALKGRRFNRSP